MAVSPTEPEARRLIATSVIVCLAAGVGAINEEVTDGHDGIALALIVVALAASIEFYRVLYTGWGRSTGWMILLRTLDPRWWVEVVRTTGWRVGVTNVVLTGAFALSLLPIAVALR